MMIILGFLKSALSVFNTILGIVGKFILFNMGKKVARSEDKISQLELELDLEHDYTENSENRPTSRDDNSNRLRERATRNKKRLS